MTDQQATELHGLIIKAAETTARDFPFVDTEDVIQSIWEAVLIGFGPGVQPKDIKGFIYAEARKVCWNIRREQLRLTTDYTYRLPDVREIMETVFDREDWPAGYTPEDAKTGERDKMAALEVRIDAIYAYGTLPEADREVLISRYHDKVIPKRGTIEELRLWRALNNLTEAMNGH